MKGIGKLTQMISECDLCPLSHPVKVIGRGPIPADIMLIGEAPGEEEVNQVSPFVGPSGVLLSAALEKAGVQDITYIANTVKCRPPGNRAPTLEEVRDCYMWLRRQIAIVQPKGFLLCGSTAAGLAFERLPPGGWVFTCVDFLDKPSITLYHPSYLLRRGVSALNADGASLYRKTVFNIERLKRMLGV